QPWYTESDTSRLSRTVSSGAAGCARRPPRAPRPPGGAHAITTVAAIQAPNRPPRTKCFVLTSRLPRWTVRFPVGKAPLRVPLDHRYAVLVEDRRDLGASAVDYRIERGLERLVAVPDGHGHVERKGHS